MRQGRCFLLSAMRLLRSVTPIAFSRCTTVIGSCRLRHWSLPPADHPFRRWAQPALPMIWRGSSASKSSSRAPRLSRLRWGVTKFCSANCQALPPMLWLPSAKPPSAKRPCLRIAGFQVRRCSKCRLTGGMVRRSTWTFCLTAHDPGCVPSSAPHREPS